MALVTAAAALCSASTGSSETLAPADVEKAWAGFFGGAEGGEYALDVAWLWLLAEGFLWVMWLWGERLIVEGALMGRRWGGLINKGRRCIRWYVCRWGLRRLIRCNRFDWTSRSIARKGAHA